MISQLIGKIISKTPPEIVLDVQGVGYELSTSMMTFVNLPVVGESATLFTHLSIREDAHQLFGFLTQDERSLFRALIKVSGIGPKLALTILSGLSPQDFVELLRLEDVSALVRLPGIGKKTAERLLVELGDKAHKWSFSASVLGQQDGMLPASLRQGQQEALEALVSLGYREQEAQQALRKAGLATETPTEAWIRAALKLLATA